MTEHFQLKWSPNSPAPVLWNPFLEPPESYLIVEFDHQTGQVQDVFFRKSADWSSLQPPSGRVRWALPREFQLRFRGELNFQTQHRAMVEMDLPFRWTDSFFSQGARQSLIPRLGHFHVAPCDQFQALERQITQRILGLVSDGIISAAARSSEADENALWDNLRTETAKNLEPLSDLGFLGRLEDQPRIHFNALENFEKPEVQWMVFERPSNRDLALEGREPLLDISKQILIDKRWLSPGQLIKIKLRIRAKTFLYLWHLGAVDDDPMLPSGCKAGLSFKRFEWTQLIGPAGCPWSDKALPYIFGREDRFRIFPETWTPDFQAIPIGDSPGDNGFFLIASPEPLDMDALSFENFHSPMWDDEHWLQTGAPDWDLLEQKVKNAALSVSPDAFVERTVFPTQAAK